MLSACITGVLRDDAGVKRKLCLRELTKMILSNCEVRTDAVYRC